MPTPAKGTPAYQRRFEPRVKKVEKEEEVIEEKPITLRRVLGLDVPPRPRVGAGSRREKMEGEGEYGRYFRQVAGGLFKPSGAKTTQRVPQKKKEEAVKPSDSEMPQRQKVPAKPIQVKEAATVEQKKPDESVRIWRVLRKGEDPEKGNYFETKEAAEAELKRLGGSAVGAVAGIKFPGKTKEESTRMRDQYVARLTEKKGEAQTGTKEDVVRAKLAKLGATPEQERAYLANLKRIEDQKKTREEQTKIDRERFFTNVAAKRSAVEQVNTYNRQLGLLRNAYNTARKSGDNITALSISEILDEYQRGVPREEGAKRKAAEAGQIAANTERIAERIRLAKEEKDRMERLSRANPDAQQFQGSSFQPISLAYQ